MDKDCEMDQIMMSLSEAGHQYQSFYDLVDEVNLPPDTIEIIVSFLKIVKDPGVAENLVRSLMVKNAKCKVERALIEFYFSLPSHSAYDATKWAIGNAMYYLNSSLVADELKKIILDPSQGGARQMFVSALPKTKDPESFAILVGLLEDSEVKGHAIGALGKMRNAAAIPWIRPYLLDPNAWIRRQAKTAIAKLERQ